MSKTYKDKREIKEFTRVKGKKIRLSYEERLELKRLKEDAYWSRLMKDGFS